ncbi:hypothetical protein ACO0LD_16790 [Undibacterium sp. Ji83W]
MKQKLLLINLESKHKVDLSPLEESFRVIIFVADDGEWMCGDCIARYARC